MVKIAVYCPKTFFRYQTVKDSISLFMRKKTAPEVKALFRQTVYGWSHKPRFQQKLTNRPDYMAMSVWASGDNANQYSLVNFGTRPHTIYPVNAKMLRFKWGGRGSYRASTTPGKLMSKRHYKTGPVRSFLSVDHPGFEARRFDQTIAEQYRDTFKKDMRTAIRAAVSAEMKRGNRESEALHSATS